jgi:hypothetical protein
MSPELVDVIQGTALVLLAAAQLAHKLSHNRERNTP